MKLTEKNILEQTRGGLTTYKALLPNLLIQGNSSNKIKSPFVAFSPSSFFIRKESERWCFEDKATGTCGDIFDFVAAKTGLNRIADHDHLVEIVAGIYCEEDDDKIAMETVLFHRSNGTRLSFSDKKYHDKYLQSRFGGLLNKKLFAIADAFELYTLNSLSWLNANSDMTNIMSGFRIDVPQIFFAFLNTLYNTEYAMIYEPFFRESYDWGTRPKDFLLGYQEALQLREQKECISDRLIITDTVESLLLYHSVGQPAVAIVDKVLKPTAFLLEEALPKFNSAELYFERYDRYNISEVYAEFSRKYGLRAA